MCYMQSIALFRREVDIERYTKHKCKAPAFTIPGLCIKYNLCSLLLLKVAILDGVYEVDDGKRT